MIIEFKEPMVSISKSAFDARIEEAKAEVAREIFEEIKICLEYEYMSYLKAYDYTLLTRIEDLENKYIGGEQHEMQST